MNCKLGGVPWCGSIPLKNTMVVGYDAYHDSIQKKDSFGAVVTSSDQQWTSYLGQVRRHSGYQELTDNFCASARVALKHYMNRNNGVPPKFVIVFRDGVGDGQLDYVKNHEIKAIKECFKYNGHAPKLLFVVVSKRINTRLFTAGGREGCGNPPPGTVVDDKITLPERYDFFLVSQSIREGTVAPTSYNVLEDTSDLPPDKVQQLAFKMTHLYYNWQGTVRVPAPCLYAHKLAYLTGTTIHAEAHTAIADKLW